MSTIIKKVIKTILFLCLTILFFEFFLRFTEISLPSFVYDSPKFGRIHKPGADYFNILAEGFGMGEVNKLGYLGPAYPKHRDRNTLRIALVGDSFVEGIQVFDRQHYRHILEQKLSKLLNKKVEVLNFGVGGYNLRDIYIDIRQRLLTYNPNIILVFIRGGNFVQGDKNPGPDLKLVHDSLLIEYNYKNTKQYKLRKEFQVLREYSIGNLIKESYEEYYRKNYQKTLLGKFYTLFYPTIIPKGDEENDNIPDKYYKINKAILEKISDYNKSSRKIFIVRTTKYPVSYDSLVSQLHLSVIELDSLLFKYSKGTDILNYWKGSGRTGHWNQRAHSIIGNYLANYIYGYLERKK